MTVEQCAFCNRPASHEVEIVPQLDHYPKGEPELKRLAITAPVCAHHAMAINRDRDWQERQRQAREAQQAALKEAATAAQLFDPAALDRRSSRHSRPPTRRRR
jgi:hypothetical protein